MEQITKTEEETKECPTDSARWRMYPAGSVFPASEAAPAYMLTESERTESVEQLLEIMATEQRRRIVQRNRRYLKIGAFATVGLAFAFANHRHFGSIPWWLFIGGGAAGASAMSQNQQHAITRLAQFNDKRAIGPFLELLDAKADHEQRLAIIEFLTRMLPRLMESDSALLNPHQREAIYEYILSNSKHQDERLVLAMLEALKQVGDADSLYAVEKLHGGEGAGYHNHSLQAAASDCAAYLRDTSYRREMANTLLRGSTAAAIPADNLLRPASASAPSTPAEEMVRPASAP